MLIRVASSRVLLLLLAAHTAACGASSSRAPDSSAPDSGASDSSPSQSHDSAGPAEFDVALEATVDVVDVRSDPVNDLVRERPDVRSVPDAIGSAAPCLVGGNVMYFDGDDPIYTGTQTVTNAEFSFANSTLRYQLVVWVKPRDGSQGFDWNLWFKSAGGPLVEQVYLDAERSAFARSGHPGIDIQGSGRGCNTLKGEFQIVRLRWGVELPTELTVTFVQHCEGGPRSLRGCLHLEQPERQPDARVD